MIAKQTITTREDGTRAYSITTEKGTLTYTEEDFIRIRKRVFQVMDQYPATWEGGPLLTVLMVWRDCDGLPAWIIEQILKHKAEHGLTDLETIRRNRQVLQNNKGLFPPSEATEDARAERAKEIKGFISKEEDNGTVEE